ncbi:aryl-sulfate sulfotransferase [Haloterrigena sp. SYSU A558-1]|uniref:Aryl-sulfate sulfotransferase n=1 Tax=Haloterrigena gelatinilytica TaxID=2741724 RepID=A0ABX2LDK2_9EURY|nr:aryl-sulfate sulfotransferase [Haloterrigena gelatinilytica]NUC74335.1 aryl-sulfate sulfotransferase [Haloterrigena gelatinilytica]
MADRSQSPLAAVRSGASRGRSALSRNRLRVVFLAVILLSAAAVASAAMSDDLSTASEEDVPDAPATENHTVVTESGRAGTITVYEPDGEVAYYNNTRTKYFDADPVEGDPMTIEYTATDTIHSEGPTCSDPPCALNVIERVDLEDENPEPEVIYERYDYKETAGEWHDSDRINETHVVVADIVADQVFIVNTETEVVEWLWDAQSDFPVEGGGPYPGDWAHINDVEYIDEGQHEGRIVASLRNQDQVVFLDREEGLVENWTLGSENDYDVQYEQHNPDYIPESQGGPAIVVADSENGRVQEFHREDGEWNRTWQWEDDRIQWPRDADRLPNGNTLIADSHGNRVIEVNESGDIVWEVGSTLPYEAERLETGPESEGGQSAAELGLESRTVDDSGGGGGSSGLFGFDPLGWAGDLLEDLLPHRIHNGLLFASPVWMGASEFAAVGIAILTGLAWLGMETRWKLRDAGVRFRLPVYRRGD